MWNDFPGRKRLEQASPWKPKADWCIWRGRGWGVGLGVRLWWKEMALVARPRELTRNQRVVRFTVGSFIPCEAAPNGRPDLWKWPWVCALRPATGSSPLSALAMRWAPSKACSVLSVMVSCTVLWAWEHSWSHFIDQETDAPRGCHFLGSHGWGLWQRHDCMSMLWGTPPGLHTGLAPGAGGGGLPGGTKWDWLGSGLRPPLLAQPFPINQPTCPQCPSAFCAMALPTDFLSGSGREAWGPRSWDSAPGSDLVHIPAPPFPT